jgi:drug/metabolite transporter (DMT)-like permease
MRSARSAALLFVATTLWGAASAVVAIANSPLSPPLVALGASVALTVTAAVSGQRVIRALRSDLRLYCIIGGLEFANLILYFAALNIGPTPVVVALHLSTPVLLIGYGLVTGRRSLDVLVCIEIALIVAAIVLVVLDPVQFASPLLVAAACAMSLGSAVAVAILIKIIASESGTRPAAASAGIQLGIAALLSLPLFFFHQADHREITLLVAAGALLLGPGFLLYWIALKALDASTAGVIGLNEAVVASLLVSSLRAGDATPTTLFAGALILVSVGLELRGRRGAVRD